MSDENKSKTIRTMKDFVRETKAIARDVADEVVADKIGEEIEKAQKNWEKKSSSEQMRAIRDGFKKAATQVAAPEADKHWFMRDATVSGTGNTLAASLPYVAESIQKFNRVDWDFVGKKSESNGNGFVSKALTSEKTLTAGTVAEGGALIPERLAPDLIMPLYERTVMRRGGAQSIEMPEGHLDMGRMGSGAVAHWIGETEAPALSEPDFGRIRLEAKKLGIIVPVSKDLIRRSPRGVEQLVREDMLRKAAIAEDNAFLLGAGSEATPEGLYSRIDADNKFEREATPSLDTILRDLMKAIFKVENADHMLESPGWIMHPRTFRYIMSLRGQDSLFLAAMLQEGQLFGYPVYLTTQLPTDLDDSGDASNDETRVFFVDFAKCLIGDTLNLEVTTSEHADLSALAGGINVFTQDAIAVKLVHEVDFHMRYGTAASVIQGVDWGSGFGS